MVLFILFPGHGTSEKFWEYDIVETNNKKKYKLKKLDFLKKLKSLGKVYKYTPKIYNIGYYDTGDEPGYENWFKIYQNQYKKPKIITLDDINIDKECKRIYNLLKDKNEMFIPIGHSKGSWFALHFSNLYPSKCLRTILIDGSFISPKIVNTHYKKRISKIKSKEITNKNFELLFNKMVDNVQENKYEYNKKINKYINKMHDITGAYYYHNMKKELNGKLKVSTISFRNFKFDIDKGKNDKAKNEANMIRVKNGEDLYNINGSKITTYYLINSGHFPWKVQRYSDQIIDTIKNSI